MLPRKPPSRTPVKSIGLGGFGWARREAICTMKWNCPEFPDRSEGTDSQYIACSWWPFCLLATSWPLCLKVLRNRVLRKIFLNRVIQIYFRGEDSFFFSSQPPQLQGCFFPRPVQERAKNQSPAGGFHLGRIALPGSGDFRCKRVRENIGCSCFSLFFNCHRFLFDQLVGLGHHGA